VGKKVQQKIHNILKNIETLSVDLQAASVLVQDGRRTKPSPSIGTDSLVSISNSSHLSFKILSFCKAKLKYLKSKTWQNGRFSSLDKIQS